MATDRPIARPRHTLARTSYSLKWSRRTARGRSAGLRASLTTFFVAFTTSSAFGPTDTPVLSRRVKILTVIQTVLSLVVIIVLVAWAVGTL